MNKYARWVALGAFPAGPITCKPPLLSRRWRSREKNIKNAIVLLIQCYATSFGFSIKLLLYVVRLLLECRELANHFLHIDRFDVLAKGRKPRLLHQSIYFLVVRDRQYRLAEHQS